jgi:hypothetical protein
MELYKIDSWNLNEWLNISYFDNEIKKPIFNKTFSQNEEK